MKLEKLWEEFQKEMIPAQVPPAVRHEMRRIFIYGAWSALGTVAAKPSLIEQALELNELMAEAEQFKKGDRVDPGFQLGRLN